MASATTSPTTTPAAILATVSASVTTPAKILARAVVTAAGRIILCGIVTWREVLGRGSVGIRLAFLGRFGGLLFHGSGLKRVVMFLEMLAFRDGHFIVRSVLSFVLVKPLAVLIFVMFGGPGQGFTGKQFHRRAIRWRQRRRGGLRLLLRMPWIVVLEVFEDVADVQEGIAVETNVHESGLHAGEDAGDFSFVDAADEREFFFPLDVDFD